MSLLQRRLGEPVSDGAQGVSAVIAAPLRLLEHGELPVGGGAAADDRAAMLDLVEATENLRVVANVLQHLLQQIGNRDRAVARDIDEGPVHAVALGAPFVLDHDGTGYGR